ncbi:hypothetical protein [Chitinophaga sp. MM2321]|uniref:hypothetical protein n=1 Tax=Chitinophaga sp. MM2321 TaxID=3137178 RepID=UPI0032D587CC
MFNGVAGEIKNDEQPFDLPATQKNFNSHSILVRKFLLFVSFLVKNQKNSAVPILGHVDKKDEKAVVFKVCFLER